MKNNNLDDTTLLEAYRYAEDRTKENKFSVREAFLAGVSYEKNRLKKEKQNSDIGNGIKNIKICPNCKESFLDNCACMRNKCIKCGKPVGNITFTHCDDCWDKEDGDGKKS